VKCRRQSRRPWLAPRWPEWRQELSEGDATSTDDNSLRISSRTASSVSFLKSSGRPFRRALVREGSAANWDTSLVATRT
jgi:hypothetical protein